MEHQSLRSGFCSFFRVFSSIFLLSTVFPIFSCALVQPAELSAYEQLFVESTRGTWTLKAGPVGTLYMLNRSAPTSAIWVTDDSGVARRMILIEQLTENRARA